MNGYRLIDQTIIVKYLLAAVVIVCSALGDHSLQVTYITGLECFVWGSLTVITVTYGDLR